MEPGIERLRGKKLVGISTGKKEVERGRARGFSVSKSANL